MTMGVIVYFECEEMFKNMKCISEYMTISRSCTNLNNISMSKV